VAFKLGEVEWAIEDGGRQGSGGLRSAMGDEKRRVVAALVLLPSFSRASPTSGELHDH
jgi:hypothetical protein